MSTVQGVFSETLLQDVRVKMTEALMDSRVKQQFIPKAEALKALAAVTTAKFTQLSNKEKDYEVELEWFNVCGPVVEDYASCTFGGDKPSTNTKKYKLNFDKMVPFTVSECDFVDNDFGFQEALAKALLRADKQLVEAYAQYFIDVLNANKGINALTTGVPGAGCVSGYDTYIPAVNWTGNLFSYWMQVAEVNKFAAPILLEGGLLYQAFMNAKFNAGNDNGAGQNAMFNSLPLYFDLFNPLAVNGNANTDYLIDIGSMSWANKVYHGPTPINNGDNVTKFSMASKLAPIGLMYDVTSQVACCDNDLTTWDYKVRLKADIFTNPTGCDEDNTGILTMVCGACPQP